jgi:hypothetical protein
MLKSSAEKQMDGELQHASPTIKNHKTRQTDSESEIRYSKYNTH